MKKKLVSFLITLCMVGGCSFGVMADNSATNTTGAGTQDIPVTASVSTTAASGTASIVYRVEISWTTPSLSGTQASDVTKYTWDAVNCCYVAGTTTNGTTTGTLNGQVTIDIKNKSNENVSYSITRAATTAAGWSVAFANDSLPSGTEIAAADEVGVAGGARASMLAGSTDTTALTGAAVSATQFSDTVTVTVPHLTSGVTDFTVATYTVTLANPATSSWTT